MNFAHKVYLRISYVAHNKQWLFLQRRGLQTAARGKT